MILSSADKIENCLDSMTLVLWCKDIMQKDKNETDNIENVCENLVSYAVDREDIKLIVNNLPEDQEINKVHVEYELQILKIISIGWGISVHMSDHPIKDQLVELFWYQLRDFSHNISNMTSLTIGQDIDYFQTLKERFKEYLGSLNGSVLDSDPASAIGPAFAEKCSHKDNPFVIISGARIFNLSVGDVKEYLQTEGIF